MTKVIGITGGIGSGKTTLSNHLKKTGYLVHESDKIVSEMYNKPNKPFKDFIKKNILKQNTPLKKIDKKQITNIIFNNTNIKKKLERYVHKEVSLSRKKFIQKSKKEKKPVVFVDIPLLLEKKLEKQLDMVVSIISSKKNRIKRVLKNKKFTKKTLNKIFKAQTSDKERRERSQIIIYNNKSKKDFIFSSEKALINLLQ